MLNQSFEEKTLLRLTRKQEIIKFRLGRNTDEYIKSLSTIAEKINSESFTFSSLSNFKKNDRTIFKVNTSEEFFALKKISDNLKRLYRVNYLSKDEIVNQVINIISDTSAYRIVRLDVKDFFESINLEKCLEKINTDSLLSITCLNKLKELKRSLPPDFQGLPRGLNISSVLSEIFMEDLDRQIRTNPNIYFYARYVDDIIIITHDEKIEIKYFKNIFNNNHLSINSKSFLIDIPAIGTESCSRRFNFLGYCFSINSDKNIDVRNIEIDISSKKIKKIKTRIVKSILSFSNNSDTDLLTKRIQFLTGNYNVYIDNSRKKSYSEDDSLNLKGGIYYNNKFINTTVSLLELNKYLRSIIFCTKNNYIGIAVRKLSHVHKRNLLSHCFISGHNKAITHRFNEKDIKDIRDCWS